jgi:ATP-dependent RNA helicase DeaD
MSSDSVFSQWGLSTETLRSIKDLGFENPTPVQSACIPHLLKNSGDLLALAKTGTGKTAAFGIPLVEKLTATPQLQALVLCPTRELAAQVADSLSALGLHKGLKVTTVLGGESYRKQIDSLRRNPQILVSTPGRLIDLMEQKIVKLDTVKTLILDEADEMLSFGFQEALETVWENLKDNDVNTWLFSATMSDSIKRLTSKYLNDPYEVALNTASSTTRVESFAAIVYEEDKEDALCLLLKNTPEFYGIIFAQTKKQVAELEIKFRSMGLAVDSLHGDKAQADRSRVIARMKKRDLQILVATDVAARGLDIEDLTHVVNFEIPWDAETYTHRIGRTARAGKTGIVWTLVRPKEAHQLRKFERALKQDFKPLHIPSVKEVRKNQIRAWINAVHNTEIPAKDQEMFEEMLVELQAEKDFVLSASAKEWMFKALVHEKVGADFEGLQPRSFDLRPREDSRGARAHSDGPRTSSSRSRPGLRSDRGAGRSGGYRSERGSSERRSARSEFGERRESRPFRRSAGSSSSERPLRSERSELPDRPERGSSAGPARSDRRESSSLRDRHPRKERPHRY